MSERVSNAVPPEVYQAEEEADRVIRESDEDVEEALDDDTND